NGDEIRMHHAVKFRVLKGYSAALAALMLLASCSFSQSPTVKLPATRVAISKNSTVQEIYDDACYGWNWDDDSQFHEGLACVSNGHGFGFIDKTGRYVIKPQFEGAKRFAEGLAVVKRASDLAAGFIDHDGRIVIPFIYSDALTFSEGLSLVCPASAHRAT